MKTKIKTLLALVLILSASATMLLARPHKRHTKFAPRTQAGSSILLDQDFNAPFFATPDTPGRTFLLPGGKYMMFFNVDTVADQSTGPLVRFNADATLDTTFSFTRDYAYINAVAPTSDGRLIIAVSKAIYSVGDPFQHQIMDILRLNDDGSIDPTFGPAQTTDGGEVRVLKVNGDGTIFVGGLFTAFNGSPRHGIVRLLADGTVDPNFAAVSMTCPAFPFFSSGCGLATEPVIDQDGKIIIAGDFLQVNGVDALGVARLNSDGTLDSSFNASGFTPFGFPNTPRPIRGIVIQSDQKIVIGGRFNGPPNRIPLVRLNTDGTRDGAYIYTGTLPPYQILSTVRGLLIDSSDKVIAIDYSVWRFNTDGSLDSTFHNPQLLINQQPVTESYNIAFADGGTSIFIGGSFTDVDDAGVPPNGERWGAAKFSATDGSLDLNFTTSRRMGSKIEPAFFLRQSEDSNLITFSRLSLIGYPAISHGFGRLLADGSLDLGFDPIASFDPNGPLGPNFISLGFTPFTDGTLLITGQNGTSASYGHLFADGSEDPDYQADPNVIFASALPRTDGKVVLSGYNNNPDIFAFVEPNGQAAVDGTEVQRINADGTLDNSFQLDPAIVADTQDRDLNGHLTNVYVGSAVLALTADDTILFAYLSKDGSYHIVRLDSSGLLDPSFTAQSFPAELSFFITRVIDPLNPGAGEQTINLYYPTDLPVKQAKVVLDNKVVLMGSFASFAGQPAHGMVRINPNGSLDPSFSVGEGAQWTVTPETDFRHPGIDNLEVGLNSKLLVTGTFEAFNNAPAPGIINLNPDGTVDTGFAAPVTREKYDYQPAYLKRQPDGSFLLSGPYSAGNSNSPSFFRLVLPPGETTPPGMDVTVNLGGAGGANDVTVNFDGVNNGGTTSVEPINPEWAGELPTGYQIAGTNLAFEIYTTATYTPPITVCFDLSAVDAHTFSAARLFHNDGSGLIDVTTTKDFVTQTICGVVNSLSPFAMARPTPAPGRSPKPRSSATPNPTPRPNATPKPNSSPTPSVTPRPSATPKP